MNLHGIKLKIGRAHARSWSFALGLVCMSSGVLVTVFVGVVQFE
jgi:hypothetical protein